MSRNQEGKWVGFHGTAPSLEDARAAVAGKVFFNFDDEAFGSGTHRFLAERFPLPCRFEKPAHSELVVSPDSSSTTVEIEVGSIEVGSVTAAWDVRCYPQIVLKSRNELPGLFNQLGLLGEGAEIGVMKGEFSATLLRNWRGRRLHCIDSWAESLDEAGHIDKNNLDQVAQDHNYNETIRRLGSFGERVRICRQSPKDAARSIPDGSLDFVYLVDRHYRTALLERLNTWVKKVCPGGILAGHNYLDGVLPSGHFEVKSTVDEWAMSRGWPVQCTGEPIWRSWIMRVPG